VFSQHLPFFISGLTCGTMCVGEAAMIIFIAAGFWRWGVVAFCAVITALNLVEIATMIASGADPLVAATTAVKVSLTVGMIVLPIAAMLAWLWREFSMMVGGLHAR
jgi:hypothetical protein